LGYNYFFFKKFYLIFGPIKNKKMKKTFFVALLATTIFACSTPGEKTASTETSASTSSCVKEGPDVDLMNKAIKAYSAGDWATLATCFSDTAKSWHNNDTVAMKMSDRIEMFKQQRATTGVVVDAGTPNLEVVTVPTTDEQYKGIKWGHAWVNFKNTSKTGEISKSLTFISFAIKDGKILWEQVIYDAK
jgi:ABC-type glycerol-3-phosphate transport system substrate-binding protein